MANSDNIIIDLSNYKDRVGARITPGTYTVLVEDAETSKSKAGNAMIQTWLTVVGGEHNGETVVDRLTLSENAMFRVVGFMQAIHLPTPKKRLNLTLNQIIGKKLMITVDDGEPYNGRVKSEVREYIKIAKPAGSKSNAIDELDDVADVAEDVQDEATTGMERDETSTETSGAALAASTKRVQDAAPAEVELEEIEL